MEFEALSFFHRFLALVAISALLELGVKSPGNPGFLRISTFDLESGQFHMAQFYSHTQN